jgi:hypothetical protein
VDHEGEALEAYVTKKRDKAAALKFLRKNHEMLWKPRGCGDWRVPVLPRGDEDDRE